MSSVATATRSADQKEQGAFFNMWSVLFKKHGKHEQNRSTDTTSTRVRKEKRNRDPTPKKIKEGVIVCLEYNCATSEFSALPNAVGRLQGRPPSRWLRYPKPLPVPSNGDYFPS
ncbi:hypothetical protein MKX08_002655 [Trichoderma sp. CBMAI-0020]|nr:hypothetical protein MKX08_002655 [Trichoderma sp. CBMAI-0020]